MEYKPPFTINYAMLRSDDVPYRELIKETMTIVHTYGKTWTRLYLNN